MELIKDEKCIFINEDECIFRIFKFKNIDEFIIITEDEYDDKFYIKKVNREGLKNYSINIDELLYNTWGI